MQKNKKRVLKGWFQNLNCYSLGGWFVWICTTIDTIDLPFNQIKGYLIFTSVWTLLAILSFYLLLKYTNLFEEE